jgi:uncharacterized protein
MYKRTLNILQNKSFFLFGARGTGKSSLLQEIFAGNSLWIDLLQPDIEQRYLESPGRLSEEITSLKVLPEWVVIDEVQKVPKLLDQVHYEIEKRNIKFALTGSSARKLKRGGANLLAGRAYLNNLFPLTFEELGSDFNLIDILHWGSLPEIFSLNSELEKSEYLKSYVDTYLKEEILQEQLVRSVVPFRKFLPIAAQMNGNIINYNKIAKDLGVDWTTVKTYFEILEDTLLGFLLPSFDRSLRKQQLKGSKFYLFDTGVKRALDRSLSLHLSTSQQIGPIFEHFIILEINRLNHYLRKDFRLSFVATKAGLEIDLIVERPGLKDLLIEIKSTDNIREDHLKHLVKIKSEYPDFDAICICQEKTAREVLGVKILPWEIALKNLELGENTCDGD